MPRKISKRVRSRAIRICEVAASNPDMTANYPRAANSLGYAFRSEEYQVAISGWYSLYCAAKEGIPPYGTTAREVWLAELDAEVAQRLREGWTPPTTW